MESDVKFNSEVAYGGARGIQEFPGPWSGGSSSAGAGGSKYLVAVRGSFNVPGSFNFW